MPADTENGPSAAPQGINLKDLIEELTSAITRHAPYILVVDDQLSDLTALAQDVSQKGFIPIVVSSSQIALQIAYVSRPSAILADQFLGALSNPDNGADLVKRIKNKYRENGSLPSLVVSANPQDTGDDPPAVSKDSLPEMLDSALLDTVHGQVRSMVEKTLQPMIDQFRIYEDLLGDIEQLRQIREFDASVEETRISELPDACRIVCDEEPGEARFVPKSVLSHLHSAYPGARIRYTIYQSGKGVVSKFTHLGPGSSSVFDEPLATVAPESEELLRKAQWKE